MKTYKLWVHNSQKDRGPNADIVINPKEFPDVRLDDILEIYDPDEQYSRLLLQLTAISDEFQQKDTISIEGSIATAFQLRMYKDVYVKKVDPQDVTLDLVELLFKEQYYSRSDMWRMRKSLVNTCAYLTKKVAFAEMRAQVSELWAKGEKVTCGVISEDTRIVFRSSTAVVSILIQMSSEMWEFDNYGDLYFEKAVDGFLKDLFAKWKEQGCVHDVTIVLFSRTFYDAKSLDEFPASMKDCLQKDYKDRIYEDFYRVVIQNERYEDWTSTLIQLKKLFNEYPQRVLHYHEDDQINIPTAQNSTAAQGNFLETLNMALNLFEKWYIDRNFDRTGKVAVVISPGVGVYEVDRELCNITKQRTIDCGVGSDLVCVGEQPLHAVPLFRFHNKNAISTGSLDSGDDYNIPHWMNHSFYTSRSQAQCLANSSFVPRIKPPPAVMEALLSGKSEELPQNARKEEDLFSSPPYLSETDDNFQFIDYDEYDAQVFKLPSRSVRKAGGFGSRSSSLHNSSTSRKAPWTLAEAKKLHLPRDRHISDNFSDRQQVDIVTEEHHSPTAAIGIPQRLNSRDSASSSVGCYPILGHTNSKGSLTSTESEENFLYRPIVGSAGSPIGHTSRTSLVNYRPNRALINPFAPSRMQFKMTSNRRRWVHAFPIDPRGAAVQTHHVHVSSAHSSEADELGSSPPTREAVQAAQLAVEAIMSKSASQEGELLDNYGGSMSPTGQSYGSLRGVPSGDNLVATGGTGGGLSPSNSQVTFGLPPVSSTASVSSLTSGFDTGARVTFSLPKASREVLRDLSDNKTWLWGPTGEQEWSPEITTGLDWRPLESHEMYIEDSQLVKPILTANMKTQSFCATISVDWKSLVIPASLPITTDYFPDKRSLHNDYVQNDYTLLPDDVNTDYWMRPPTTEDDKFFRRQPLKTKQVFRELISQRLGQGFQMILMPKVSPGSSSVNSVLSSSPQYQGVPGRIRARARPDHSEEYYLSIGRIFHRLNLTWPNITVTRYRPRHPQPQLYYNYRYRLQAPDSYNYDVSWTKFSNEKLENYNWNYLDQYICTRGEGDYGLMESLKFWRSRFLLLPSSNPATKKILEGHPRCDIYEEKCPQELKQLIDGFLRFLEILNKLKRTAQTRKLKGQQPKTAPSTPVKGTASGLAGNSKPELVSEERNKGGMMKRDLTPDSVSPSPADNRKILAANLQSLLISQISNDVASVTMGYADGQGSTKPGDSSARTSQEQDSTGISVSTPSQEVVEAMKHPDEGFQFLTNQAGLPPLCFVSAEAFDWCMTHIRGIESPVQAIHLMQKLLDEKYICHASGSTMHKFVYGFYLYVFLKKDGQERPRSGGDGDLPFNPYFSNEWCEVAGIPIDLSPSPLDQDTILSHLQDHDTQPEFHLSSSGEERTMPSVLSGQDLLSGSAQHRVVNVDVDTNGKSDRPEWATARYHTNYSPNCAFELQLQWMVSTGTLLAELVYSWGRKASSCGFHLLPVPIDPFALPYTPNSDPLRGPIFVPLNMDCLLEAGIGKLFEEDLRVERLLQFQEAILKRFGFMPDRVRLQPQSQTYKFFEDSQLQYAHCTGGMFVLIPDSRNIPSHDSSMSRVQKASLLHHEFIARQTSHTDIKTDEEDCEDKGNVGFLWSWNFMSSKRWRSSNTGDEAYQDKMLADFRQYTANTDGRLLAFWLEYREQAYPHLWGQFASTEGEL